MTEIQGKSSSVRVSARFRDGEGSSYRESTVFFSYGRTQDALCINAGGLLHCHSELQMYKAEFQSLFTCDDPTDYQ